jgi:hypothetical protein
MTIFQSFSITLSEVENTVNMRVFRKTVNTVSVYTGILDIKRAFGDALNVRLSLSIRIVAAFKGIFGSAAILTSSLASYLKNPELAASFRSWCSIFALSYAICGGDTWQALAFIFNSKHF